jgi:hypothetical protein
MLGKYASYGICNTCRKIANLNKMQNNLNLCIMQYMQIDISLKNCNQQAMKYEKNHAEYANKYAKLENANEGKIAICQSSAKLEVHIYYQYAEYRPISILHIPNGFTYFL